MSETTKFWLWYKNEPQGPFRIDTIGRMAQRNEISRTTLFWSETRQEWRPLSCFIDDQYPVTEKLMHMKSCGFKSVRFMGSGTGDDCPACTAMEGNIFPIDSAPSFPIDQCSCNPWPRCIWLVTPESD